jgi:hypothetical protein
MEIKQVSHLYLRSTQGHTLQRGSPQEYAVFGFKMVHDENNWIACVGKFMCVVPPKVFLGNVCPFKVTFIIKESLSTDVKS